LTSALDLRVTAAIIEERPLGARDRVLDGGDEDGVIACLVSGHDPTLEVGRRTGEEGRSVHPALNLEVVEPIRVGIGEAPGVRLLILGEYAHADPLLDHE